MPDLLSEVRIKLDGTEIAIYFGFAGPEDPVLTEQAQMIGTEVISHASPDMRISEHITFAAESGYIEVGRSVFERGQNH